MASALCSLCVRLERIGVGIGRAIAERGRSVKKAINWLEGRTESVPCMHRKWQFRMQMSSLKSEGNTQVDRLALDAGK